jgi:hypothetical protein
MSYLDFPKKVEREEKTEAAREPADLMLESALALAEKDFHVFRCEPNGKRPLGGRGHLDATTDPETIIRWWTETPEANIGIACDASKLVVIDVDTRRGGYKTLEALEAEIGLYPDTVVARTGCREPGLHLYYRVPEGMEFKGKLGPGIDIKHHGYVVAAPSVHPDGGRYEWITSPLEIDVAKLAARWLERIVKQGSTKASSIQHRITNRKGATSAYGSTAVEQEIKAVQNATEGERNTTLNRAAFALGQLHAGGEVVDVQSRLVEAAVDAGLSESEATGTVASGWSAGMAEPRTAPENACEDCDEDEPASVKARLVEIACRESELMVDDRNEPYALLEINGRRQLVRVWGTDYKGFLADAAYEECGQVPGSDAISAALNVVEARARRGQRLVLWNRVARGLDGAIWLDLGDGRAVRVTREGWNVVADPPPLFRHYPHQLPIPEPVHGGNFDEFLALANISDDEQKVLFKVAAAVDLVPDIGHPMKVFLGLQGSAKTFLAKMYGSVIDPSVTPTLCLVDNIDEMVLAIDRHHVVVFDNVSGISQRMSDLLCQVITGGAYEKRRLYTDVDAVLMYVRRPLIMTAINLPRAQADLQDRSIIFNLDRIDPARRRPEAELLAKLEAARPRILGALLDMVAGAMREYDSVDVPMLARMADFTKWGVAVARACGTGEKRFLEALARNGAQRDVAVIEDDAVGAAVKAFAMEKAPWNGSPTDFYRELSKISGVNPYSKDWPRRASDLSRRINILKPALVAQGIVVSGGRPGGTRGIRIELTRTMASTSVGKDGVHVDTGVPAPGKTEPAHVPPTRVANSAAKGYNATSKVLDSRHSVPPVSRVPPLFPPRGVGGRRSLAQLLRLKPSRQRTVVDGN